MAQRFNPIYLSSFNLTGYNFNNFVAGFVCQDSSGNFWVTDTKNPNILKFNSQGVFVSYFTNSVFNSSEPACIAISPLTGNLCVSNDTPNIYEFSFSGTLLNTYITAAAIVSGFSFDNSGYCFLGDLEHGVVYVYTPNFVSIQNSFTQAAGVIDVFISISLGLVYITNAFSNQVFVYSINNYVFTFSFILKNVPISYSAPFSARPDFLGYIYTTPQSNNHNIYVFDSSGNFLLEINNPSNSLRGMLIIGNNLYVASSQITVFSLYTQIINNPPAPNVGEAQKGRSFTLSVIDPSTNGYDVIGGFSLTSLKGNNKLADVTDKDSESWEEFLATLTSVLITGQGTFKGTAGEILVEKYFWVGSSNPFQVSFENGSTLTAAFIVKDFEYLGNVNDLRKYNVTLQSSFKITYASAQ
jgi:predicted secreted protein